MSPKEKKVFTQTRLRNLKRAKIRLKETELDYLRNHGANDKEILTMVKEIHNLKNSV